MRCARALENKPAVEHANGSGVLAPGDLFVRNVLHLDAGQAGQRQAELLAAIAVLVARLVKERARQGQLVEVGRGERELDTGGAV